MKDSAEFGIWLTAENPIVHTASGYTGWAFSAPSGDMEPFHGMISGDALILKSMDLDITLNDSVYGDKPGNAEHSSEAIILPVKEGKFPLFVENSSVKMIFDDNRARVVRVTTTLCLNGAVAYTDLWMWKGKKLLTLVTYFDAPQCAAVKGMRFGDVRSTAEGVSVYTRGAWKQLENGMGCACALTGKYTDLRVYSAERPAVTHIAWGGEMPDVPVFSYDTTCQEALYKHVLQSGDLTVELQGNGDGLGLGTIEDAKSGCLLKAADRAPLFRLALRTPEGGDEQIIDSLSGWSALRFEANGDRTDIVFSRHFNKDFNGITVRVTAECDADISRIRWLLDVSMHTTTLSVTRLDPPILQLDVYEDSLAFMALDSGVSLPFKPECETIMQFDYPQITLCMQYLALWRKSIERGVYCGYHDPVADLKVMGARLHDGICSFEALIPTRGMGDIDNSFSMDGELVWQLFDGDWYDATMLYRDFVHTRATWFTRQLAINRADIPEWMLKAPLWFQMNCDEENWLEKLLEAVDDIGVPAAVHMYRWHQIPFDTNYPHYKPAREDFVYKLPIMQAHGIRVMPYINGRLWDTHDRGDYDYQFSSIAKPNATKGWNGDYIDETYMSKNTKGEPVRLAVMCPSTAVWQEKVTELVHWITCDLGCDGVYIDQIGAAQPVACMDRTHPHRPGGGSWWYEHYYNLLDHVRLHASSQAGLTTEANGEVYSGHIGSFLVWHWSGLAGWSWKGDVNVPAFQAIYAEYQPTFGRCHNFKPEDDVSFRLMTAQSLCYGNQLGWLPASFYLASQSRDFFKRAAQLREAYGEYFYAGRCLRPPRIMGDVKDITDGFMTTPSIISAHWKRISDGRNLVILANLSNEPANVTAMPDGITPMERMIPAAAILVEEI